MVDFSKIRGSKISVLKTTRQEAEKKSFTNNGKRPGFLEISEGINIFRICPPSSPDLPSYFPLRTSYLECDLPKLDDDGNEVKDKNGKPIIEKKKKRIFIATIHGENIPNDPIELYCQYVNKRANDEIQDKDLKAKFLSPVNGFKDKKGVWTPGIRANTTYVFYAFKNGELGRLEVYSQILKRMDELSISEDKDIIIEIDPFSDPQSGVSLIIDYDKTAKSGEKYRVSKRTFDFATYLNKYGDEVKALAAWKADKETEKLSQEQLEEWYSKEPLVNIYKNVYCMRDFELAVNGLRNFDATHNFGIFENDEFLAELEKIQKLVPEKNPNAVDQDSDIKEVFDNAKKETSSTPKQETKGSEIDYSTWNKIKCKKKIEAYILDNYGADQPIPELDLETAKKWCLLVDAGEELPFDEVEETPQTDGKSEIEKEAEQANAIKANKDFDKEQPNSGLNESQASKIAALRKKAGK